MDSKNKKALIRVKRKQLDKLFENANLLGHPIAGTGGSEYKPQSVEDNEKTFSSFKKSETVNEDLGIATTLLEFAKNIIEFLQVALTDSSSAGLSPFWKNLGVSRGELFSLLTDFGIVGFVGYKMHVNAKNFKRNIKRLYSYITDVKTLEKPAPKNTYKDTVDVKPEENLGEDYYATPEQPEVGREIERNGDFTTIYVDDDVAILKDKSNSLFFFYYATINTKDFAEYSEREKRYDGKDEDGDPIYDYSDSFEVDADAIQGYVNDNISTLTQGVGVDGYENGDDIIKIDGELKDEIVKIFGNDRLNHLLDINIKNGIEETTGAASSGSFVGPLSATPIKRPIVGAVTESNPRKIKKNGMIAQVKKLTLNYREADNKNMTCGKCEHYNEETKNCEVVWGKVNIDYICDAYKGKKVDETDASSSGQYTSPMMWAKTPKDARFAKKPIWDGGTIVETTQDIEEQGGGFVSFDDCTKLNNNKKAQNGGCSVGAVDKIVKVSKTKK